MATTLQIALLFAVAFYFVVVLHLLKTGSLNLKYTLLWLLSGIIMLVLAVFPGLLDRIAHVVGVYEPTNALFAIILFCVIIILMSLTAIVSRLNEKCKCLIQKIALLEARVRELENDRKDEGRE